LCSFNYIILNQNPSKIDKFAACTFDTLSSVIECGTVKPAMKKHPKYALHDRCPSCNQR
jgi:hypothetical protein